MMKLPYRVLVLEDDENALAGIVELLSASGYEVTPASAYEYARRLLSESSYDLFMTDVRLRSYNGLHLVKMVRQDWPDTAVIIMTGYDEPLMELEASRYSARFIKKPIKSAELLEVVRESVSSVRRERRWPRKRVIGGFRVTVAGKAAAVVDVSYGGLCLEIPATDSVPAMFDVEVSGINLHLMVEPVWSIPSVPGAILCGAALASDSTPAARTWREIVDRLSA
jgi:two-component system, response regulator PdtaR